MDDPGTRSALKQTRELAEEVEELKRKVAVLQRTVTTLAAILEEEGVAGGAAAVRRRIAKAVRGPREPFDLDMETADEPDQNAPAVAGSPYRGAMPARGPGCAVCGKALEADDPELSLSERGRVCLGCFHRG